MPSIIDHFSEPTKHGQRGQFTTHKENELSEVTQLIQLNLANWHHISTVRLAQAQIMAHFHNNELLQPKLKMDGVGSSTPLEQSKIFQLNSRMDRMLRMFCAALDNVGRSTNCDYIYQSILMNGLVSSSYWLPRHPAVDRWRCSSVARAPGLTWSIKQALCHCRPSREHALLDISKAIGWIPTCMLLQH